MSDIITYEQLTLNLKNLHYKFELKDLQQYFKLIKYDVESLLLDKSYEKAIKREYVGIDVKKINNY